MENSDPCPICGIPGQVCVGEAVPPTHIIGVTIFPSLGHEDVFLVEDDVWEDRTVIAPVTTEDGTVLVQPSITRVRIAKKGDALRMSDARRLGLLKS